MTDFLARLDTGIAARGTSRAAVSKDAGYSKDLILNWARYEQSPTIGALGKVSDKLLLDPAWLAYGDKPLPRKIMAGYHAKPVNRLSDKLEEIFSVWENDGFGLPLFNVLEQTGLRDSIYLLSEEETGLRYDHIGVFNIHTLGFDWWHRAIGKYVGEGDPDPEFAFGCLNHYRDSLQNKMPRRDRCEAVRWAWDRAIFPFDERVLVVTELRA